jgi:hypothetical protein
MAKPKPTHNHTAEEYARLQRAAHQMLDAADTAARRGDHATEQRADAAAGRYLDQASKIGADQ